MSFALICIASILVLGLLVAIGSFGSADEPIVEAHDCSTCTSKDDGSCKIACLMEEKKRREAQQQAEEKKSSEGNNQKAERVLNEDDA